MYEFKYNGIKYSLKLEKGLTEPSGQVVYNSFIYEKLGNGIL